MEIEIIDFQNDKWVVKHKTPDKGYSPEMLQLIKEYRRADMVLKKSGILIFVEKCPDTKFEEIPDKHIDFYA